MNYKKSVKYFFVGTLSIMCLFSNVLSAHASPPGSYVNVGNAGFSAGAVNYVSMALDLYEVPYIAFADASNGNKATVMKFDGTNWNVVGTAGFSMGTVTQTKIAIDSSGNPYVAYIDGAQLNGVTVMHFDGTNWSVVGNVAIGGQADYLSLVLDSSDHPYVAYQDIDAGQKATVYKWTGTTWVALGGEGFTSDYITNITINLDSNNVPYILFSDHSTSTPLLASVMKWNGSAWSYVHSPGFSLFDIANTSISFDSTNHAYATYADDGNNWKATTMKDNGSAWVPVGSSSGYSAGIAGSITSGFDHQDHLYVAYDDNANGDKATIKEFDGTNWVDFGSPDFSAGSATYVSMSLPYYSKLPYVAYIDGTTSPANKATVMRYKFNYSGSGLGTALSPYIITTCSQFMEINNDVYAHYLMANDLDCTSSGDSIMQGKPVSFKGTLDGGGHNITIAINNSNPGDGLFWMTSNATITNLGVLGSVTGANNAGSIIGNAYSTSITKSYSNATVTGNNSSIGGLVGGANGLTISDSFYNGNVAGTQYVGGLIGLSGSSGAFHILRSYATGTITTSSNQNYGGGLVGFGDNGTISDSFSASTLTNFTSNVGAITGGVTSVTDTNTFYDSVLAGALTCDGAGAVSGCTGIDTSTTPNYFKYNHTNAPFLAWDFSSIPVWNVLTARYPILHPFFTIVDSTTTASPATNITTNSATLNGSITATGGENNIVRGFNWGTTQSYGTTTTENGSFGTGDFTASLTNLSCNTTYHYQTYSTNSAGNGTSSDATFTTSVCPHGGGGGGGGTFYVAPPVTPSGSHIITINLPSNPRIAKMVFYNYPMFLSTNPSPFQASSSWDLCTGVTECAKDTVFVTLYDKKGFATFYLYNVSAGQLSASLITAPSSTTGIVPEFSRTLKLKDRGEDVTALQVWLNTNGYVLATSGVASPGKENPYFGTRTRDGLKKFQRANGLKVTGTLNQETIDAIQATGM